LKANKTVLTGEGLALTQWAEKAVGLADVQVQIRLRGNHLHVLCEALISPDEKIATSNFSGALTQTNLTALLPPNQPIYKIFLSGRSLGAARPDWTVKLEYTELQFQTSTGPSKAVESPLTSENIQPIPEPRQNPLTKITSLFRRSQPQELAPAHRIQPGGVEETIQPEPEPFSSLADEGLAFTSMPLEFNTEAPAAVPASSLPNTQSSTTLNPQPLTTNNEPLIQPSITDPQPSTVTAIEVSTESLARQGYPDAIASYLSEILGGLGVGVKVTIREKSQKGTKTEAPPETNPSGRRLWVLCESAYSPDPSLLAQPIAQRLRQLQLEGFRDACILLQVQGESTPDWMLRIDLTSPDRILKQWGRWGDEQAIARLINDKLSQLQVEVRTTLKESTLHLFCTDVPIAFGMASPGRVSTQTNGATKSRKRQVPDKQAVMDIVIPLLDILAPQGICAVTVYGLETTATQAKPGAPIWVDWLNLPAAQHSDLQPTALTLAEQGNLSALRFVLTRLVNPDLELKLATGGIRVLLLQKAELLHVMTEGATCPSQSQVAPVIAQFLRNHRISGISGVRIYGRRSGQKLPLWRYGIYLKTSQPDTVPSVLPDFVTPPEEGETLGEKSSLPDGLVLRPDLNLDHLEADVSKPSNLLYPNWREVLDRGAEVLAQGLVTTRLFAPRTAMMVSIPSKTHRYQKIALALVWATLGGLFVVQVDKILGELLVEIPLSRVGEMVITTDNSSNLEEKNSEIIVASDITESQKNSKENDIFNGSNFISSTVKNQKCNLSDTKLGLEACKLAQFLYPTFKSPQLDEQLARYQHFILTEKRPPDIMIIGSSRALRGIDPGVLETELKARGYGKLKVYNFGVNGATVQIVDLIIRQILPPEQLPKLIILADGVRALNSGRVDRTYETISASEGYQQISQGTFQIQPQIEQKQPSIIGWQSSLGNLAKKFHQGELNFEGFQTELNQQFVGYSQVYEKRDRLQFLLQSIVRGEGFKNQIESPVDEGEPFNDQSLKASEFLPSGFLPLSTQFSPEIYYQNHSQVSGYYDGDYKGFELEGKQTTALKNLIEYVDSKNINLVFVNMPLTEDYLDQVRMAYEEKFRDFMQSISQETGITFIDLSGELLHNYNYFSDPSHLNQYGAVAVSQKLVELDQIPWPRRK